MQQRTIFPWIIFGLMIGALVGATVALGYLAFKIPYEDRNYCLWGSLLTGSLAGAIAVGTAGGRRPLFLPSLGGAAGGALAWFGMGLISPFLPLPPGHGQKWGSGLGVATLLGLLIAFSGAIGGVILGLAYGVVAMLLGWLAGWDRSQD